MRESVVKSLQSQEMNTKKQIEFMKVSRKEWKRCGEI